ncbi:hypothetical protein BXY85_1585 [Roseivirga pacifica]|uniref:DUF3299 domain-containing protein n=1 Tax=Roseivirga pacifica TaxID=1267423 RepID=A0A1I0MQ80_9BACT|nr:hypothetical protein [Roseivirga pacifica]MCO6359113.1 hypothetical protein [Roseivirga pacifica]MCO6365251.1 hypothetical protein [Roseivirga pacifica]MCO6372019.1 hypothetical protein [Roseivirga pacifica]MCO6375870.1 hypothetical protein [Roseivirga pacifica]MCO6379397.1 hypothetical protein [Roseivirga pacifica]
MRILLVALSLLFINPVQEKSTWKTLAKVTIEKKFDELMNFEIDYPTFSEEVKALDGKEISLEGWMIPLDELRGENYFVLSALPFANCFFCGGAGPETVVEVFTTEGFDFTEDRVKVTGTLSLNADDPSRLMYVMSKAEVTD